MKTKIAQGPQIAQGTATSGASADKESTVDAIKKFIKENWNQIIGGLAGGAAGGMAGFLVAPEGYERLGGTVGFLGGATLGAVVTPQSWDPKPEPKKEDTPWYQKAWSYVGNATDWVVQKVKGLLGMESQPANPSTSSAPNVKQSADLDLWHIHPYLNFYPNLDYPFPEHIKEKLHTNPKLQRLFHELFAEGYYFYIKGYLDAKPDVDPEEIVNKVSNVQKELDKSFEAYYKQNEGSVVLNPYDHYVSSFDYKLPPKATQQLRNDPELQAMFDSAIKQAGYYYIKAYLDANPNEDLRHVITKFFQTQIEERPLLRAWQDKFSLNEIVNKSAMNRQLIQEIKNRIKSYWPEFIKSAQSPTFGIQFRGELPKPPETKPTTTGIPVQEFLSFWQSLNNEQKQFIMRVLSGEFGDLQQLRQHLQSLGAMPEGEGQRSWLPGHGGLGRPLPNQTEQRPSGQIEQLSDYLSPKARLGLMRHLTFLSPNNAEQIFREISKNPIFAHRINEIVEKIPGGMGTVMLDDIVQQWLMERQLLSDPTTYMPKFLEWLKQRHADLGRTLPNRERRQGITQ